ncbi:hypothetical protein ZHAS_00011030 [Anopheles sinensis]|uniref:Uncharacterized protein n=1 Tax=Anopheles sinensis TaxID=74873 RepID=A0A084VZ56_ANOSI|nr:hypothetical protein ZHAS_00011030 [Anopheles sinensis]
MDHTGPQREPRYLYGNFPYEKSLKSRKMGFLLRTAKSQPVCEACGSSEKRCDHHQDDQGAIEVQSSGAG